MKLNYNTELPRAKVGPSADGCCTRLVREFVESKKPVAEVELPELSEKQLRSKYVGLGHACRRNGFAKVAQRDGRIFLLRVEGK